MTLHDELVLALIQEDEKGAVPLHKIVGSAAIAYELEAQTYLRGGTSFKPPEGATPDIVVKSKYERPEVAIEVETDMDFDFGESLYKIKKYSRGKRFGKVYIIIPKEYERFVPLYKNEGFNVYLWTATRIWECTRCGNITFEKKPVEPKCAVKNCGSWYQRLKGIKDTTFTEA